MNRLIITSALIVAARFAVAEVQIIKGGEADQPAGERSESVIYTRDRQIVPATTTTKETKTGPETGRRETITRLRDANGAYFDWQRASTTSKELSPGTIERTTEVVERDRQGGERERKLIKQTSTKSSSGEQANTSEYRQDSSGNLALDREVSAVTTKNTDGSTTQSRTERDYDVNGRPVTRREVDAVTTTDGNLATTVSTTKSTDHLTGNVGVTGREVTRVQTTGNTTQTEIVRQKPAGATWENEERTMTTTTRSADGTIQRESVTEGRSLYARQGGRTEYGELRPLTKTVDREVRQPDGTVLIKRELYRRDVNGEWTPTTFSTQGAQAGY